MCLCLGSTRSEPAISLSADANINSLDWNMIFAKI